MEETDVDIIVSYSEVVAEVNNFKKLRQDCKEVKNQFRDSEIDEYEFFDSIQALYDKTMLSKSNISCYVGENAQTKSLLRNLREKYAYLLDEIESLQDKLSENGILG